MILSNKGMLRFKGDVVEIRTDLTAIICAMNEILTERYGAEESKKMIMRSVEMAFIPEEELDAHIKEMMNQKAQNFSDEIIKMLLGGK